MRASHGLTHKFTGFFITVERDASDGKTLSTTTPTASKSNDDSVGTFHIISHAISKFSDLCPNIVTHTNSLAKSDVPVMIFNYNLIYFSSHTISILLSNKVIDRCAVSQITKSLTTPPGYRQFIHMNACIFFVILSIIKVYYYMMDLDYMDCTD